MLVFKVPKLKPFIITFVLILLCLNIVYAQKINLEKWVSKTVDSLKKEKIDTIEYYHSYCGECWIIEKPVDKNTKTNKTYCDVGSGWVQIENIIIYKQKNKYYTLSFNCNYPPIKKELASVKSLDYFISIIPILYKGDKTLKHLYQKNKFNPPIAVDGGYEEAYIYWNKKKQSVFLQEDQKTSKVWNKFFWIPKQVQLLKFIKSDIALKNQLQ